MSMENKLSQPGLVMCMSYGDRLQKAMQEAGRERKELAQVCGCTVQNLGMVITSAGGKERALSAAAHVKAARFLAVDSYWLATGVGKMRSEGSRPGQGLTDDALEVGQYFDKLTHKVQRTRAYVTCMAAILKELDDTTAQTSADQSIAAQDAVANPEKRPA